MHMTGIDKNEEGKKGQTTACYMRDSYDGFFSKNVKKQKRKRKNQARERERKTEIHNVINTRLGL